MRHIRAGEIADLKAIAGGLQIGGQGLHLRLVQPHHHLVQHDIHIGGNGRGKNRGLGAGEASLPCIHANFGGLHRVAHCAARIDRHIQRGAKAELPGRRNAERAGVAFDEFGLAGRAV